jgi:hypothetical protein
MSADKNIDQGESSRGIVAVDCSGLPPPLAGAVVGSEAAGAGIDGTIADGAGA